MGRCWTYGCGRTGRMTLLLFVGIINNLVDVLPYTLAICAPGSSQNCNVHVHQNKSSPSQCSRNDYMRTLRSRPVQRRQHYAQNCADAANGHRRFCDDVLNAEKSHAAQAK